MHSSLQTDGQTDAQKEWEKNPTIQNSLETSVQWN